MTGWGSSSFCGDALSVSEHKTLLIFKISLDSYLIYVIIFFNHSNLVEEATIIFINIIIAMTQPALVLMVPHRAVSAGHDSCGCWFSRVSGDV